MKKLLTSIFLVALCSSLFSQIKYEIELLSDNETYLISFVSGVDYLPPGNKIVSGQVTIRMPHGIGVNAFQINDLVMETPGATWQANDIVRGPSEAPSWDYFSFALTTPGVDVYNFQAGVSIPIFSFKNGGEHCADSLYIIDNFTDPFIPPNSVNTDVRNSVVVFGGGFSNVYDGPVGNGSAPGTPETLCVNEMIDERIGCDSVIYEGVTFIRDTVFDIHYTSSVGCDSVFITQITIQDELFETVDTTICEGDIFKGIEILQDDVLTQTYITDHGCDSTVTYLIQVVMPTASETDVTVLSGDAVNGITVFSDTTIVFTLTNANGCDSLATVNVSVYSGQPTFINGDVCIGEIFNGEFYMSDTTFTDSLMSVSGFDSLVFYNIDVHEAYYINSYAELCQGQPHSNGIVYDNDTTFVENFQSVHGCDSNITTSIHVIVPEYFITDTSICKGELYQGILYEEDVTFTESVVSVNGCDSLVTQVNLTVNPALVASIEGVTEICEGDETVLTASGGTQYLWSDGSANDFILAPGPGTYLVTVTSAAGCTAETSIEVEASGLSAEAEIEHPKCHFELSGAINFTNVSGGFEPYVYSIDGGNFFSTESEFPNLSPGEYSVQVQDQFGCYWEDVVEIVTPDKVWVEVSDDDEIRLGESTQLQATTNLFAPDSIIWSPAFGLECPTCLGTEASPLKTTNYTVTVIDENGCSAQASVTILVRPEHELYVPNAFSPNGDGFNDTFTVFGGDNILEVHRFAVFDRWGGQVFNLENFSPNNLSTGWNGLWRNEEAPEGLYIWMAEVEFLDGKMIVFEGNVNLIR